MSNNISEYITNNTQEQRQSHIDLSSECIPYYLTKNTKLGKKGDFACKINSLRIAKQNLLKFLNISDFNGTENKIQICHKCENNSGSKYFVCVNQLHLYFGTISENVMDKDPEVRKRPGRIGGKKSFANGTHISQQIFKCPHCQKSAKGACMYRHHFDNCKYNPKNILKSS